MSFGVLSLFFCKAEVKSLTKIEFQCWIITVHYPEKNALLLIWQPLTVLKASEPGRMHSTEVAFLLLTQQSLIRFPAIPKVFFLSYLILLGFIDGTALTNVERFFLNANGTHLVLARCMLVP